MARGGRGLCSLCFVGADSVYGVAVGVGVCVFAVFCENGLGTVWPVGVGVCVFAVFRGNVLGTAWPVGVGVYVFAVFRGSGLGTEPPFTAIYRSLYFIGTGTNLAHT